MSTAKITRQVIEAERRRNMVNDILSGVSQQGGNWCTMEAKEIRE